MDPTTEKVAAFVSPLIAHVRLMDSGAQKTGKKDTAFKNLVSTVVASSIGREVVKGTVGWGKTARRVASA